MVDKETSNQCPIEISESGANGKEELSIYDDSRRKTTSRTLGSLLAVKLIKTKAAR